MAETSADCPADVFLHSQLTIEQDAKVTHNICWLNDSRTDLWREACDLNQMSSVLAGLG